MARKKKRPGYGKDKVHHPDRGYEGRRRTHKLRAEFRAKYGENWFKNKPVYARYLKLKEPWKTRSYGGKKKAAPKRRRATTKRKSTTRRSSSKGKMAWGAFSKDMLRQGFDLKQASDAFHGRKVRNNPIRRGKVRHAQQVRAYSNPVKRGRVRHARRVASYR